MFNLLVISMHWKNSNVVITSNGNIDISLNCIGMLPVVQSLKQLGQGQDEFVHEVCNNASTSSTLQVLWRYFAGILQVLPHLMAYVGKLSIWFLPRSDC